MIVSDLLGSIDQIRGDLQTVMFTHYDEDMGCLVMIDRYSIEDIMTSAKYTQFRISKIISWYTYYDDDNFIDNIVIQI
jgi:hypothetical protein